MSVSQGFYTRSVSQDFYERSVQNYLGPIIRWQGNKEVLEKLTGTSSGNFLQRTRDIFQKKFPQETFSESRLREVYIDYAITGMHEKFTVHQPRTANAQGISSEKMELHCGKLNKALQEALQRDFSQETQEDLTIKITLVARVLYDDEIRYLTRLLIGQRIGNLRASCRDVSSVPSRGKIVFGILSELERRFPHDQYEEAYHKLLEIVRPELDFLKLEIEASSLLKESVDQYVECETISELPDKKDIVDTSCSKILHKCPENRREELVFLLQEQAEACLDSLRKLIDPHFLRRVENLNDFLPRTGPRPEDPLPLDSPLLALGDGDDEYGF